MRSGRDLMGFITLSRDIQGERYGTDDCDLLWTLASQTSLLLSNARLAEERAAAREFAALHRFSAFCLHDLKNLASRLSLVGQNAEVHGNNHEFQQSVMRTVNVTAQKMKALINKLSLEASPPSPSEVVDVDAVIGDTVTALNGQLHVQVEHRVRGNSFVRFPREQFQQILMNLIMNAQEAAVGEGKIMIENHLRNGSVVITVTDTGPGIPSTQLRTLFHPFRTTKKDGFGIGLYQSKQTIEEQGGSIRVSSVTGHGTSVRIELPVANQGTVLGKRSPSPVPDFLLLKGPS